MLLLIESEIFYENFALFTTLLRACSFLILCTQRKTALIQMKRWSTWFKWSRSIQKYFKYRV